MTIDKDSYGSLALVYSLSALAVVLLFVFVRIPWLTWPLTASLLWFCIWQTRFFSVPDRKCSGTDNLVSSVADGRVVIAEKVFESEVLGKEALQVSVYMNFFDFHANFWPVNGEVTEWKYRPGKHTFAYKPKSSLENEHTWVKLRTASGKEIMFKQIAGGFARRIVCHADPGLKVQAGKQLGIIKFGSRIDILLPLDAKIKVKPGDLVRACESVIAEL